MRNLSDDEIMGAGSRGICTRCTLTLTRYQTHELPVRGHFVCQTAQRPGTELFAKTWQLS
jgi:hypothetical protein